MEDVRALRRMYSLHTSVVCCSRHWDTLCRCIWDAGCRFCERSSLSVMPDVYVGGYDSNGVSAGVLAILKSIWFVARLIVVMG